MEVMRAAVTDRPMKAPAPMRCANRSIDIRKVAPSNPPIHPHHGTLWKLAISGTPSCPEMIPNVKTPEKATARIIKAAAIGCSITLLSEELYQGHKFVTHGVKQVAIGLRL